MAMKKISIGGLKSTTVSPVEGVISPTNSNTASPNKVGSQAVVKTPKPKQMADATDKPSVFYKSEQNQVFKKNSIKQLHNFLSNKRSKNSH